MKRQLEIVASALVLTLSAASAFAQTPDSTTTTAAARAATSTEPPQNGQAPIKISEPTVTVIAQKEPADPKKLPVSVTAVTKTTLDDSGATTVSDSAVYAPNTFFSEFTARKLSNARFRGIGSSPANPGITTYIDGVPQLNTNSSSLDLLDVSQVEFVRGAQSALFGRNTLGGVINITSTRPSLEKWTGGVTVPFGNFGAKEGQGFISGPVAKTLGVSVAVSKGQRDGFTTNDLTTHDLDSRSSSLFKGQVLWAPMSDFEARVVVTHEKARDGDYALNDLATLRANPFHAARDFEGHTDRDITSTSIQTRKVGARVTVTTALGFVNWKTLDLTDLDYTPLPLVTRNNAEKDFQYTHEVRVASSEKAPVSLGRSTMLRWQIGASWFKQNYDQDAVNSFAPGLISQFLLFPIDEHTPTAALDDKGFGIFGQGTLTLGARTDITVGLRADRENKKASLTTSFVPQIQPDFTVTEDKTFSDVSPQFAFAFRAAANHMFYASVARGFKAGGFNPASLPGSEIYDEERAWHVEGGLKSTFADGRMNVTASVFSIDWTDLQLNVPIPGALGQFFIDNVGDATSRGIEFDLNATPNKMLDLFATAGWTNARFSDGSVSSGVDVSHNRLPLSPEYTGVAGVQLNRELRTDATLYGRAEIVFYGPFHYDDANLAQQDAYSLTNLRAGVRFSKVFVEAWVKNAGNTHYIPLAFSYPFFAASGFVGEMGRPRTFGVNVGMKF